jgi:multidrug efflux pump subunit AcrA (membrane-fusion protein)
MKTLFSSWCILFLLAASAVHAADRRPAHAQVPHCQVLLKRDVDLPAEESGSLVSVHVEDGQEVFAGMLLVQVDDNHAQLDRIAAELERDAALAKASDDIEVRYAIKSHELADSELSQSIEINRRSPGAVPTTELRRQQLAKHRAELQIDRSRLDLRVAQMTANVQDAAVQAAEVRMLRRQIKAPFDGTVIEVLKNANEWVNAGEPVLRLIQLDELYVDGFLSGAEFDCGEVANRSVTVEVDMARGRHDRFDGRIVFVNPLVQAGNKFRVRALVANRKADGSWLLHPGVTASMTIHLE